VKEFAIAAVVAERSPRREEVSAAASLRWLTTPRASVKSGYQWYWARLDLMNVPSDANRLQQQVLDFA
jgi:hypothetical protein